MARTLGLHFSNFALLFRVLTIKKAPAAESQYHGWQILTFFNAVELK